MVRTPASGDGRSARAAKGRRPSSGRRPEAPEPRFSPRPRDEQTRRRIVLAAAAIYREWGYERAGMSDIARRVGMTAPALYWYFRSKEDILVAFLEHTITDLIRYVAARVRANTPQQRLREFVEAYVAWQLRQQALSAAYEHVFALGHLRNSLPESQRQRITSLEREFYGLCRSLIVDVRGGGGSDRRAAPVAFAMIGMVEHLLAWFRPRGAMSVKRIAALYADLAVAMAAAAPPGGEHRAQRGPSSSLVRE